MAVLIVGFIGAGIGAEIGGTILGMEAASVGWMAGSMLGSMLGSGQRAEGPRVGDRMLTSSTLGTPMATIYGAARTAGNVIQCSEIREVKHTKTYGGFLGRLFGTGGSTTTYTYNCDLAVDLCAGPIAGIRKMWMDGKLVYDISSTNANVGSVMASSANALGYVMYPGDEAQMPDPTLEALAGVGNVPAYRGRCYVVFQQLDCPFGRIPQLTFEVVAVASSSCPNPIYSTMPSALTAYASVGEESSFQFDPSETATHATHPFYAVGPGWNLFKGNQSIAQQGMLTDFGLMPVQSSAAPRGMNYALSTSLTGYAIQSFGVFDKTGLLGVLQTYDAPTSDDVLRLAWVAYDDISGGYAAIGSSGHPSAGYITLLPSMAHSPAVTSQSQPIAFYNSIVYTTASRGSVTFVDKYDGATGVLLGSISSGQNISMAAPLLLCANSHGLYALESGGGGSNRRIWKITDSAGWTLLTSTAVFENLGLTTRTFFCNDSFAIVGPSGIGGGNLDYRVISFSAIGSTDANVADIITDQCLRAGLTSGQIDVSGISDTVTGYPIQRVSPARDNITPLLKAFFIDCVDVDNKLVFKKRANQLLATTIAFDELAAVAGGGTPGDPFPLVRTQESDLPRSLTVQFIDINADYQSGAEQAIRQITTSINDVQENIAICTDGTHMHQVAEVRLFDMWSARSARSGATIRKYAFLCPGDIVSIEYPAGTFGQWLLTSVQDTGLLIEFTAVEANAALYQSAAAGADDDHNQTVDPLPSPAQLVFADIPLLHDLDNYPGAYVALAGLGTAWPGASLYIGLDDSSLSEKGAVNFSAPIGLVENALGDWTTNTIDESNLLTVNVGPDTLASTTRDAVVGGTDNLCVVGAPGRWEVMQFIRATSLGSGRYTLSGWKRGMFGTEQYRSSHLSTDRFCRIIVDGVLKPHFALTDLNTAKHYVAITTGLTSAFSDEIDTDTGVCLKPLSPIYLRLDPQTDGSVNASWGRRTRLSSNWLAGIVPLGEVSEKYEIDITPPGSGITTVKVTASPKNLSVSSYVAAGLSVSTGPYAECATVLGGNLFTFGTTSGGGYVITKRNLATLALIATSATVGVSGFKMVTDGASLFTVQFGVAPSTVGKVQKWDTSLTAGVSLSLPLMGDGMGLAYCAGSVWVSCPYTQAVKRLDPTTLAVTATITAPAPLVTQSLTTDGTYVYACDRNGDKCHKIDPATNACVLDFLVGRMPVDSCCAGGLVWVLSGYEASISAFDPTTGMRVYTVSGIPMGGTGGHCSAVGNTVQAGDQGGLIVLIDATTGLTLGTIKLASHTGSLNAASLVTADRVLVGYGSGSPVLDYYDRKVMGPGTVISVYQMSDSVGRGYPATITL